mmetsp:Transcript_30128/g.57861  ORF Transcript_30128/g.57861 Transcript_30128/m.57861 type:complete len:260 (-) Transcript_30128:16-795(-)
MNARFQCFHNLVHVRFLQSAERQVHRFQLLYLALRHILEEALVLERHTLLPQLLREHRLRFVRSTCGAVSLQKHLLALLALPLVVRQQPAENRSQARAYVMHLALDALQDAMLRRAQVALDMPLRRELVPVHHNFKILVHRVVSNLWDVDVAAKLAHASISQKHLSHVVHDHTHFKRHGPRRPATENVSVELQLGIQFWSHEACTHIPSVWNHGHSCQRVKQETIRPFVKVLGIVGCALIRERLLLGSHRSASLRLTRA